MKDQKWKQIKRISDILFAVLFVGLLLYPFLRLDRTEIIDSPTENRRMTMWPGLYLDGSYNDWYGHYVEDRVAFREEAVRVYMDTVYGVFGEFSEDLHMYGKEGEVFPADQDYIRAYQHLATDEELIDSLVTYLDRSNSYLQSRGIPFVFLAGLDKKTVYGDYMPDTIHVDESRESIMENLSRKLDEKGVPYVIPVAEFRAAASRDENRIYNKVQDTAHWNENGLMIAMELLNETVRSQQEEEKQLPAFSRKWFKKGKEQRDLEFLSMPISEEVPVYTLKKKFASGVQIEEGFIDTVPHVEGPFVQHLVNEKALSDQTLLIFGDSFIQDHMQYLTVQYRDVYSFGRQNYQNLQTYVEQLEPDVVVFENAERAFVDDLYNYTELANVTYPAP